MADGDPDNRYVVAIRKPPGPLSRPSFPPSGCAVYAERADPAASAREFSVIVAGLPAPLGKGHVLGDQTKAGPYGIRTLRLGDGRDDKTIRSMMMAITDEQAGGTYQVTMQLNRLR
ncbi:NMCC_0638 family (lipo)protein [Lichenicoccus sp.]|uniref:NMCC_0638 family (lipo)protein n=1 Tax=Lichenicoccus sp. TaxID=2781899 RepID=UPI003D0FB629